MGDSKTAFRRLMETNTPSILGQGYTTCAFDREIVNFGTAESCLLADYLEPLFRSQPSLTARDLTYRCADETLPLRRAISDLYAEHLSLPNVDPDRLVFGSGIGLVIEQIGLALCNPGDVVLIGKPTYPFAGFFTITGARLVYIDLANLPAAPPSEAKLLLLVNPGNPFGDILPDQAGLLAWAAQSPQLHVVVDEVFALSNRHGEAFVSMAGRSDADPARVHHVYGLSKDWCMAGVHLGIFWTRNDDLFAQMRDGSRHFRLSSCTKAVLVRLFGDRKLRDEMIEVHRKRLAESENVIVEKLKQAGVPVVQSENSCLSTWRSPSAIPRRRRSSTGGSCSQSMESTCSQGPRDSGCRRPGGSGCASHTR
jgi:aspartate/methionine/tyrosine aminotransferase